MQELCKLFQIQQVTTSRYRPQSNGSLERSHMVLAEFIKHYVDKFEDWDKLVQYVMFSYNIVIHESTNFSPFEIVFGKQARLPNHFPEEVDTYNASLGEFITRMKEFRKTARENLIKTKMKTKKHYDRKAKEVKYEPGDNIFVQREGKSNKFDSHYDGPYKISEILDKNNVIFINDVGKRTLKHIDKIKPAYIFSNKSDSNDSDN